MTGARMEFRIADTFTDSLARLTGEEQKAVKTTAFDLQIDPVNPGMSFHKLANPKDKRFWPVRVNNDLRLIVHRTADSLLLCYVDHHDKAYAWAETLVDNDDVVVYVGVGAGKGPATYKGAGLGNTGQAQPPLASGPS